MPEPGQALGPAERRFSSPLPVRAINVMVLVFGLPGLALLSGVQSAPGQVFAGDRSTNAALGVGLLLIAAFFITAIVRKATLAITLHAHGLRWREKGHSRDVLWDDIVEVRGAHTARSVAAITIAKTSVYRLRLRSGDELLASNMLADVHALAARIERHVLDRLLPVTRASLDAGEAVQFGAVTLSARGVELGDRVVAWAELESVTVADGTLAVRGGGGQQLEVEWSTLPNAHVLLAVLEERQGRR